MLRYILNGNIGIYIYDVPDVYYLYLQSHDMFMRLKEKTHCLNITHSHLYARARAFWCLSNIYTFAVVNSVNKILNHHYTRLIMRILYLLCMWVCVVPYYKENLKGYYDGGTPQSSAHMKVYKKSEGWYAACAYAFFLIDWIKITPVLRVLMCHHHQIIIVCLRVSIRCSISIYTKNI